MNHIGLLTALAITTLSACNSNKAADPAAAGTNAPATMPVIAINSQNTVLYTSYPASIEGIENVEIRPKVDGFIEKIYVDEGASVRKGQLLVSINAPQYEQAVRTAKAAVNSAEADVNTAQLQVAKTKPLVEKDIISKFELESAELLLQTKKAALAQAQAALINANVNLGYTRITSPVDGVVGVFPFKTGSLVSSNMAQPLTSVSNNSKVYAYFSMNEKQALEMSRNFSGKNLNEKLKHIPAVQLVLADGSLYADKGRIDANAGTLNAQTGSIALRATFSNPNTLLTSGASASIKIPMNLEQVLLVPQKSTIDMQGKKFVFVVDESGKAFQTEIEVLNLNGDNTFVVTKGLKAGDRIVYEGFNALKDGTPVKAISLNTDSVYQAIR